jgi:hypothetical protein
MNHTQLRTILSRLRADTSKQSNSEQLEAVKLLIAAAQGLLNDLRTNMHESETAKNRTTAKRKETSLDTKPPVKPVRVSEPAKPKKPKYSGNHAPSARR